MESPKEPLRLRLVFGKFQVTKLDKGLTGLKMVIALGGSVSMTADLPIQADVRLGDWITLYTEVFADANALPPPVE